MDRGKNRNKKVSILINLCMLMQIMLKYINLNLLFVDFVVMYLFVVELKILMIFIF